MNAKDSWSGSYDRNGFKDIKTINTIDSPNSNISTSQWTVGDSNQYRDSNELSMKASDNQEENPVSVFDAAAYLLKCLSHSVSTMKLHKLLYYCQAWSMVWDGKPLFKDKIEAWANGPVVRTLFNFHRGMYEISYFKLTIGDERNLSANQKETVDSVLKFYGDMSATALINQTHFEQPWRNARRGLLPDEVGDSEISLESMQNYYSSLSK